MKALQPILMSLFMLWVWYDVATRKSEPNARHVYILSYLMCLSLWLTGLIVIYAIHLDAFDVRGFPQTVVANWLVRAFKFFADIESDLYALLALGSVVVVPQALAYLFAALVGCSARIQYLDTALDFVAWSFAKSLAVASGMFFATAVIQLCMEWDHWLESSVWQKLFIAEAFAFMPLGVIRYRNAIGVVLTARYANASWVKAVHRFATRTISQEHTTIEK